MDYTKDIFPLNNFVLLSKGWLRLKNGRDKSSLEAIAQALDLDGYGFVKTWDDVISIVSTHYDGYNEWKKSVGLAYWDLRRFLWSVSTMESYASFTDKTVNRSSENVEKRFIVYSFMDYFAFNCGKGEIVLSANHFSPLNTGQKRLFDKKSRFVFFSRKEGMTYKEMNTLLKKRLGEE